MIDAFGFADLPVGIQRTGAMCESDIETVAYHMSNQTMITMGTTEVFPDGFPVDFSVMLTIRPSVNTGRATLFSIYSSESKKVLALMVGRDIAMYYEDPEGCPLVMDLHSFGVNIADDRWDQNQIYKLLPYILNFHNNN